MKGKIKFPLWFMAPYILHLFLSACGSGDNSSPANSTSSPSVETGSIQFNIAWQNAPISIYDSSTHAQLAELDCANSGISTVEAKIYDESNLLIASGEWNCIAHFGTIANVKAGSNRTLVIFGKDSQGNNIFVGGPLGGITLLPNQTYNAGTITAIPYSITLISPTNDLSIVNCNFSFQWFAAAVGKSEIQIDDSIDFSSPVITEISNEKLYTPTNLNPGRYYWRVRTVDGFGNPSKWSEPWTFTIVNGIGLPPSSPTGVNATAGDGQVTISWNSVSGATGYNLYGSTSPGVSKVSYTEKISNVTSPSTYTGKINGTPYYYVVTAVNDCGESNESSQVSATPGRPPSAPTGVNATAGDGQVTISWNSVSGATGYNLYGSTSPGVSKVSYTEKIPNVTTPFTNTGRINGTTYYYVVAAINSYGESNESSQVSATPGRPPSAPTGVNATAGDGQVVIRWNGVSDATSYNLYWSTSPGVSKVSYTSKISNVTSPFTNTGKINGTPYYYVVTAVNNYGESSESSQVSATPGRPPSAPTGVNATAGDGQVVISWNGVSDATSYNLYWSTSPGVSKVSYTSKISNVTSPFTNTGKSNGTTYYYVVTAVNNYGESSESSQVSATPGRPPSAPTGVNATAGDEQVVISWNSVSGATSYNLYWSTSPGVSKVSYAEKISNVTSPFTHTGRSKGTTYYYVVTAVDSFGESSESSEVSARPKH